MLRKPQHERKIIKQYQNPSVRPEQLRRRTPKGFQQPAKVSTPQSLHINCVHLKHSLHDSAALDLCLLRVRVEPWDCSTHASAVAERGSAIVRRAGKVRPRSTRRDRPGTRYG